MWIKARDFSRAFFDYKRYTARGRAQRAKNCTRDHTDLDPNHFNSRVDFEVGLWYGLRTIREITEGFSVWQLMKF